MKHKHIFKSGERVLLKVRKGRKDVWHIATFQAMQTRSRVIVSVVEDGAMDGEVTRLVELRSIKPYYDHPTDQQRRARHAARLYRQGVRMFRLDKPEGKTFALETIDVERSIAVGHVVKRKTVQVVPLHSLWPEIR